MHAYEYREEAPQILCDFLTYHEAIQAHSEKTVHEYFLDLRTYFRFLKLYFKKIPPDSDFETISIMDVDLAMIAAVKLTDVYSYMDFLSSHRRLGAAARARKVASLRSFYKYLTTKAKLLKDNPLQDLESPRLRKTLPRFLTYEQSVRLLNSVDGANKERNYCILDLFLNCGLRISELVGLNIQDIQGERLRVLGKGNKERILYLSESCREALDNWLAVRPVCGGKDKNALFVSKNHHRLTTSGVHYMVKEQFLKAGLDATQYSSHKLRHTAATLMLQNGVDVRTLQEVLGHDNLNTTQIYTHVDNADLRLAAMANPLSRVKPDSEAKKEKGESK